LLMWIDVPMPTLAGEWQPVNCPRRHAVLRFAQAAIGGMVIVALVLVTVPLVGTAREATLAYSTGVTIPALFVGFCLGAACALAMAWVGCVRRAWCLDRGPPLAHEPQTTEST